MNPYAVYIGNRQPMEVIAATTARLRTLLDLLGDEGAQRSPAPGKWTAREIICHLADCEIVFAFRLRQALAENHPVIQPFDQERWATQYGAYDVEAALAVFAAVRQWNLTMVHALPAEAFSRMLNHPERGDMTFQVVIETMAGHDLNHLDQIERIATQAAAAAS